jgi:hypothetical protein
MNKNIGLEALELIFEMWQTTWTLVTQAFVIAVCEIARSIFDYQENWKFYFPDS